jgi:putative sugar O-methyltransferase
MSRTPDLALLAELQQRHRAAPPIYHATRYWEAYEASIAREVARLDVEQIDSGLYPYLATFGFGTAPYRRRSKSMRAGAGLGRIVDAAHRLIGERRLKLLPYGMTLADLHALALERAELAARRTGASPPTDVQAPALGEPQDRFGAAGRFYSVSYITYYLRYCFVHGHVGLRGDEVIAEIGSGSCKQAAVLCQVLPRATILCFDLPLQLFLGYEYLRGFMADRIVEMRHTLDWTDLSALQPGRIHFFGNWQAPILRGRPVDLFWNAASFGEMEPHVVRHYLEQVADRASWIYLMQARHGKQSGRRHGGVQTPQTFEDYSGYLPSHELRAERPAQGALRPYRETGGYFEAVWQRSVDESATASPRGTSSTRFAAA